MIVMKFGGTSVESASALERVAGIVRAAQSRSPLVVVSAMGKTTNKLLAAAQDAAAGRTSAAAKQAAELREAHLREASLVTRPQDRVQLDSHLDTHFTALDKTLAAITREGELTSPLWDEITSYGERLSSVIAALAFRFFDIPAQPLDAREVMITDGRHTQAQPLYARAYAKMAERIPDMLKDGVVVMGGFIGSTPDGVTTTLGRGGSDFSASIAGAGIGAEEIQIWTDVDGMLTCDPRIAPGGHLVKTISFAEAAELAYFGAKVLHPATVLPAIEKDIPVWILNSRRPGVRGTQIVPGDVHCANPVKSIACKRNITVVTIRSLRMLMAHGFLRRIFEVFDRYQTSVDMVSTSEVSVSLTIDDTSRLAEIREELDRIAEVSVIDNMSIICMVGDAIGTTPGVGARIFTALKDWNVRMVSQGASLLNISFLVADADLQPVVEALHREFFATLDPEVFEA